MNNPKILYAKEGFQFIKNDKNNYSIHFEMENNHIMMAKIIDFSLVKLIYDLNGDIYEKINIEKVSDNEVIMIMLIKNLFEDLGLPQRFSYVRMKKCIDPTKITFHSQSILDERPKGIPDAAELLPIKYLNCECDIITQHKISFICNIVFENYLDVQSFAEKAVGLILFKIFKRLKQFIENVRM